mmetsp:Transcript_31830/g.65893  ORF Transcript_31830/g.65893 Transcript_31830/m.65893 type:complete len:201 (+) Transcript_31830:870-1472(+)
MLRLLLLLRRPPWRRLPLLACEPVRVRRGQDRRRHLVRTRRLHHHLALRHPGRARHRPHHRRRRPNANRLLAHRGRLRLVLLPRVPPPPRLRPRAPAIPRLQRCCRAREARAVFLLRRRPRRHSPVVLGAGVSVGGRVRPHVQAAAYPAPIHARQVLPRHHAPRRRAAPRLLRPHRRRLRRRRHLDHLLLPPLPHRERQH